MIRQQFKLTLCCAMAGATRVLDVWVRDEADHVGMHARASKLALAGVKGRNVDGRDVSEPGGVKAQAQKSKSVGSTVSLVENPPRA